MYKSCIKRRINDKRGTNAVISAFVPLLLVNIKVLWVVEMYKYCIMKIYIIFNP
jgi:hypothetical protein